MSFENEHPNGNFDKKRKSLQGDEKDTVAILLTDNALAERDFRQGEQLEVKIGDVSPGELAAVLQTDGRWFVGYLSVTEGGIILAEASGDRGWVYFPNDTITARGCVFRPRANTTPCVPTNIWLAETETFVPHTRPIMTWQMDAQGVVTHADPLWHQFLELSDAELRAGAWKNRIHPDDRTNYLRARTIALAENMVYQNTVRVLDAREEYHRISIIIAPFRDDAGIVTGWHAVAQLAERLIKRSA